MTQTIPPVDRRHWLPSVYMDEMIPLPRRTPDAWLCRAHDGAHGLGDYEDELAPVKRLTEGQVITFDCCDDLGTSRVTIKEGGDALWEPLPPAEANHFWCGNDHDTICDTAESYAERQREYGEPQEICCLTRWSIQPTRCRFTAQGGPPRFVPITPIPPGPAAAAAAPSTVTEA